MRSTRLTFVGFLLAFFAIGVAWAFATPLGATPDEPAHLIKAASVARGELLGEPTDEPAVRAVRVPDTIGDAHAWPCFAFRPEVDASCQLAFDAGTGLVEARTSAGLYNPVYYAIVGWPSLVLSTSESAVYGMRVVSALACALLLAVGLTGLSAVVRRLPLTIAVLAAATPMVGFLLGAVNPNAFEISAGVALLGSLLAALLRPGVPPRWTLAAVAGSGVLLANTRGLSPLWMILIAVVALALVPWPRVRDLLGMRRVRATLGVLVLGVAAAGGWILATGTLGSMGSFPGAGTESPLHAFAVMLTRIADPGLVGVFGWLDTLAPFEVYALWSALILGVVAVAIAVSRGRALVATLVAFGGVVLLPAIVQAASVRTSGYIWQGRYALVALAILMLVAAVVISRSPGAPTLDRRPRLTLVGLVAGAAVLGHVAALAFAIRRYAVGFPGSLGGILDGNWAPPGGSVPWLILLALGAAGLAATSFGGRSAQSAWRRATDGRTAAAVIRIDGEAS